MSEGRLPKPQLRGLHLRHAKQSLVKMMIFALTTSLSFKFFFADKISKKIDDFYRDYDPMPALERMNKAGLMQSYEPK